MKPDGSGGTKVLFLNVTDDDTKGALMAPIKTMQTSWKFTVVISLMAINLTGCSICATKQDWHYFSATNHRARDAWKCCFSAEKRKCLSAHFERGFKQGFFDTSTGKDCRVPPVAPPRYWAARYQCCEGQACVQDWFKGYQQGIVAAENRGYKFFNDVPVSSQAPVLNRTACGLCQSLDPCECHLSAYPVAESTNESEAVPMADQPLPPTPPMPSAGQEAEATTKKEIQAAEIHVLQDLPAIGASESSRKLPAVIEVNSPIGLIGGYGTPSDMVGPIDLEVVGAAAIAPPK